MEAQHAHTQAHQQLQQLQHADQRRLQHARKYYHRLAASVSKVAYSPAAQQALAEVERAGRGGGHCVLRAPAGVAVEAWVAALHSHTERAAGPLVWVWGGDEQEQQLDLWRDPLGSPLQLAVGGTLALLDAHALSGGVQRYIAHAAGDEVAVVAVVNADTKPIEVWLDAHLVALVGAHQVVLPSLAQRAEDLRALALLMLSRIGVHLRGEALGLSLAAQQLLNEHDWVGNDAELEAALWRAAVASGGPVIDAEHLAAALPC